MLTSSVGCAIVTDPHGTYQGVVEIEVLTDAITRMRSEAQQHYDRVGEPSGDGQARTDDGPLVIGGPGA
jgi:hypothetical protein